MIEPVLLPYAPASGCKFYALTVYLHSTFTEPFWSDVDLESSQTSAMVLIGRNSQRLKAVSYFKAVGYFHRGTPSWMFDRILNTL